MKVHKIDFLREGGREVVMLNVSSMTDNSMHNGFFKTLLPVEVIDVYKLIFDADDIKDARFEKITF